MESFNSYREMTKKIKDMNEEELMAAINYEVSAYGRPAVIQRLHMRYGKLRNAREREMLISRAGLL
jgi:arsenate reductase-like glutaredoxin family protein